jgi:hypothetical protein
VFVATTTGGWWARKRPAVLAGTQNIGPFLLFLTGTISRETPKQACVVRVQENRLEYSTEVLERQAEDDPIFCPKQGLASIPGAEAQGFTLDLIKVGHLPRLLFFTAQAIRVTEIVVSAQ